MYIKSNVSLTLYDIIAFKIYRLQKLESNSTLLIHIFLLFLSKLYHNSWWGLITLDNSRSWKRIVQAISFVGSNSFLRLWMTFHILPILHWSLIFTCVNCSKSMIFSRLLPIDIPKVSLLSRNHDLMWMTITLQY